MEPNTNHTGQCMRIHAPIVQCHRQEAVDLGRPKAAPRHADQQVSPLGLFPMVAIIAMNDDPKQKASSLRDESLPPAPAVTMLIQMHWAHLTEISLLCHGPRATGHGTTVGLIANSIRPLDNVPPTSNHLRQTVIRWAVRHRPALDTTWDAPCLGGQYTTCVLQCPAIGAHGTSCA
jgi:hypothetical protein